MTGNELTIGSVGVSIVLSILLRMIYGTWEVSSRVKPWIATGFGVALAVVVLLASEVTCDMGTVVTYLVRGFMTGATATGLYEMTRLKE
jgi:hypothetical protein